MTKKWDSYKRGVLAAAAVADEWSGTSTSTHRLGDVVACKLNATRRLRPRLNKRRLEDPRDAWVRGLVTGIAEMNRRLLRGADNAGVVAVARGCGITLAVARKAGVGSFDLRELRRAGVT